MRDPTPSGQRTIRLRDGRRLGFQSLGDPRAATVFYLHGAIGTPLGEAPQLDALARGLGISYVLVARPGFGASDPQPGRRILDFAHDLRELADTLGRERFALVGVSAGGPYALACARELGERVSAVAACSSLSPLCAPHATPGLRRRIRLPLHALARAPWAARGAGALLLPAARANPRLLLTAIALGAARSDRLALADRDARLAAFESFRGATAGGVAGMVEDYLVCSRPWGFDPGEVATEVHVWHGMCDEVVPAEHALQLAASLPRCRTFLDPDEGHHFFRRRMPQILALLTGQATHADAARVLSTRCDAAPRGDERAAGLPTTARA